LSISAVTLLASTISWYSGSASIGPHTGQQTRAQKATVLPATVHINIPVSLFKFLHALDCRASPRKRQNSFSGTPKYEGHVTPNKEKCQNLSS